jgi:hypothetical protein
LIELGVRTARARALRVATDAVASSSPGLTPHARPHTFMPVAPTGSALPDLPGGRHYLLPARVPLANFQPTLADLTAAYHAQRAYPRTYDAGQAPYARNLARPDPVHDRWYAT